MTDRASVAAVLASAWAEQDEAMYRALTGASTLADLEYRHWTSPMKATTGRICLRIDTQDGTKWIRWTTSEQFRLVESPGDGDETVVSRTQLRQWLVRYSVRPVLIEDTPFGRLSTDERDFPRELGQPSR